MAAAAAFLTTPLHHLSPFLTTTSIAAITISAGICYYLTAKRSNNNNKQPPLPPGPRGAPVLGSIPMFLDRTPIHRKFTALAAEYGPIFKFRVGTKLYIVLRLHFIKSSGDLSEHLRPASPSAVHRQTHAGGATNDDGGEDPLHAAKLVEALRITEL
ncbi:unnamed protein product [Linum tenue]|uniref:Uncharacterized protein n=1 Tax=Linum tenue TaxID=586396 RepID=A0AAV0JJ85_9ROSI|nr:unnamed protein product [Linum tenue]